MGGIQLRPLPVSEPYKMPEVMEEEVDISKRAVVVGYSVIYLNLSAQVSARGDGPSLKLWGESLTTSSKFLHSN